MQIYGIHIVVYFPLGYTIHNENENMKLCIVDLARYLSIVNGNSSFFFSSKIGKKYQKLN